VHSDRGSVKNFPDKGKNKNIGIDRRASCQVPQITGRATEATPEALYSIVSGLATNTNSIFGDGFYA
jgi:hypothetical protein